MSAQKVDSFPSDTMEHVVFSRARSLPYPFNNRFPTTRRDAQEWKPFEAYIALGPDVLVAMNSRIECKWSAYIQSVPGEDHTIEYKQVLRTGTKLPERIARAIFPEWGPVPYAA